jgi:hypothetical protein
MKQAGSSLYWLWLPTLGIVALSVRLWILRPSPLFQILVSLLQVVAGLHGYHPTKTFDGPTNKNLGVVKISLTVDSIQEGMMNVALTSA